jgi:chromosome segregation ATPase
MSNWEGESNLNFEVRRLRTDVDELIEALERLPERLGSLTSGFEQTRTALENLHNRNLEQDGALRDVASMVKRLDARVEWLERNIRLHQSAVTVELDDVPAALRQLATVAEAGQAALAQLLSEQDRRDCESAIAAHEEGRRQVAEQRRSALVSSRVIANTEIEDEGHQRAAEEFRAIVAELAAARRRGAELAERAREAVQRMDLDARRRLENAELIAQGERASAAMQSALRTRIADAVGEGALLPTWFTSVLGPIPPVEDTREWMDAATALLAYRVTYGVTDPVVALGGEPREQDGAHRRAWHHRLRRRLRDLQR